MTTVRHDPPPYRKVWRSIVASDKLAIVSFEARWLYVLLLVEQDDDGDYLWTPVFRRKVTVGTPWTDEQTTGYADELVNAGLCERNGNCIRIVGGPEKNGQLRNYNTRFVYPGKGESEAEPAKPAPISKSENYKPDTPAWAETVNALSPSKPLTAANVEQIVSKYGVLDLDEEAMKFADYWQNRGLRKGFTPYLSFNNWLKRSLDNPSRQSVNSHVDTGFYPEQIHQFDNPDCPCPRPACRQRRESA